MANSENDWKRVASETSQSVLPKLASTCPIQAVTAYGPKTEMSVSGARDIIKVALKDFASRDFILSVDPEA